MRCLPAVWGMILFFALANQGLVGQVRVEAVVPQPVMLLCLDFSPDGSQFVVGGNFGLWVFETETGRLVQRITGPGYIRTVVFSPSVKEQFVTWGDDDLVQFWEVGRLGPTRVLRSQDGLYRQLIFSPDGRQLVSSQTRKTVGVHEGDVTVWNAKTGDVEKNFRFPGKSITSVAFSRDGELLALATKHPDAAIEVYDRRDWKRKYSATIPDGFPNVIKFLDDEETIVIAGGEFHGEGAQPQRTGKIWLAKLEGGDYSTKLLATGAQESYRQLSSTANSKSIVVGTFNLRTYFNARGEPYEKRLISQVHVRRTQTGELLWSADGKVGEPYGVTICPDSSLVAFCSGDSVTLLAADSGKSVRTVTAPR